jgi:predicted naringenin-chalcone synthase
MTSMIHGIETAVPAFAYSQDYAMSCMKRWVQDKVMQRMVHAVYRQSGIERRFSVLPDFQPESMPKLFLESPDGRLTEPSTGQRNLAYTRAYPELARNAVRRLFERTAWLKPHDVTHVITVSCTGFCNPGPDLMLTHAFDLPANVERYHLGFMGCYAAFPALRMADQFCRANPDAVVLILCVELCSLHLQIKSTPDSLLANALFADGAGAVLVSSRTLPPGQRGLALDSFATRIIPEGEKDMAWTIGDRGFDMVLSSYVPRILGMHAKSLITEMANCSPYPFPEIPLWAIHPGGKAILTAMEQQMGWEPGGPLNVSHHILREFGNMSSATILFVLQRFLETSPADEGTPLGAMAFGPGLTVEFAAMSFVGSPVSTHAHHVGEVNLVG